MSFAVERLADFVRKVVSRSGFGPAAGARLPDLATQEALRESEERLRLIRRATGLGMYEIDWLARRRYWSPELRAILCVPPDADINTDGDLLERIIPDDMRTRFREKLQASLVPESGGDYEDEHRITRFDGTAGWILLRGKTFFAEGPRGRRATRSIGLVIDITDRKRAEEANALHASTVLSSTDAIFSIAPDLTVKTWNKGAERLYGFTADEMIGHSLRIICPDDLRDEQADLYARTIEGAPVVLQTRRRHKDGHLIPVGINGSPIFDVDGRVSGVAAVHRDMTEQRRYEEHIDFTLRELSHRSKNLLAVVQGLSHMIARRSDGVDEFVTRFSGCIQALAYSHDLLVQHEWQGATLEELLRVQLAPFGGLDGGRFSANGPTVHLHPRAMQSLGLVIHELATNATKHGALSAATGTVAIEWTNEGLEVCMTWREQGGPPVRPPERTGFGQTVFGRLVGSLEGRIETDFRPEGFFCAVRMGADSLRPEAKVNAPPLRRGTDGFPI